MTVLRSSNKLRSWRRGESLTQSQAGARFGVTRKTWHSWETGSATPGPALMVAIYEATGGFIVPNDWYDLPSLTIIDRAA